MLNGSLEDFPLADVLRLLSLTSKTGRLSMEAEGRIGRVDLLDGRVRDASGDARRVVLARRILGAGVTDSDTLLAAFGDREALPTDLQLARHLVARADVDAGVLAELVREQTVDAVFDLMRWEHGIFRFETAVVDDRGPSALDLALAADELLDEVARRLDAWPSLTERTGPLGGVVSIRRPSRDRAEVALPPDGWTLLGLVDGRRTLAQLVDLCGQGEYRTRRSLGALLDEGVVAVGASDGLGAAERLVRDHAALAARETALTGDLPMGRPAAATTDQTPAAVAAVPSVPAPAPAPARAPAVPSVPSAAPAPVEPSGPATPATPTTPATPATPATPQTSAVDDGPEPGVRQLRTRVRDGRLRTDPSVDEDLVTRLIEGVEAL